MFLISIILFFLTFTPSFSLSAEYCGSLFGNHQENLVASTFQKISDNDLLLKKIEDVRYKYEHSNMGDKYGASLILLSHLKDIYHLPGEASKNESEKRILENGIDNLMQDLVQISPGQISAKRLLAENSYIIQAHLLRESGKEVSNVRDGNVVLLNKKKISTNSDYIGARKIIFELIDAYRLLSHIEFELRRERVEELLLADVRFSSLKDSERDVISLRLSQELMAQEFVGSEIFMERYFSSREKEK